MMRASAALGRAQRKGLAESTPLFAFPPPSMAQVAGALLLRNSGSENHLVEIFGSICYEHVRGRRDGRKRLAACMHPCIRHIPRRGLLSLRFFDLAFCKGICCLGGVFCECF